MTSPLTVTPRHGELLMGLVHLITSQTAGRTTMELNVRQRLVIQRLGQAGESSMVAVTQSLGFSPSTMTGLVDRLEEQGYAERRSHPSDRRTTLLALTKKGRAVFAQEVEFYRSIVEEIADAIGGSDRSVLLRALERLPLARGEAAA